MQNLSQRELRYIVRNIKINGYKSVSKDNFLRIINNKKNKKRREIEKVFLNQEKVFTSSQERIFLN